MLLTLVSSSQRWICYPLGYPALTEETRRDLAKEVKKVGENAKVAIRNIRRDAMDEAKKQEKSKRNHRR